MYGCQLQEEFQLFFELHYAWPWAPGFFQITPVSPLGLHSHADRYLAQGVRLYHHEMQNYTITFCMKATRNARKYI